VLDGTPTGLDATLYADGVMVGSSSKGQRRPLPSPGLDGFRIGGHTDGEAYFSGRIADVAVYAGAHHAALIWPTPGVAPVIAAVPASLRSRLLAHYPLVTPAGTPGRDGLPILDDSGHEKHAKLYPSGVVPPLPDRGFGAVAEDQSLLVPTPGLLVSVSKTQLTDGTFADVTDAAVLAESDRLGHERKPVWPYIVALRQL